MKKFDYHTKIRELTTIQLQHEDSYKILAHVMEELGETASAMCIEDAGIGKDYKEMPKETSAQEAVDAIVCTISLFYARGGDLELFLSTMEKKLGKWEKNQSKSIQNKKS